MYIIQKILFATNYTHTHTHTHTQFFMYIKKNILSLIVIFINMSHGK